MLEFEAYEYMAEDIKLSAFEGNIDIENLDELPSAYTFHTHEWYELFIVKKGKIVCHFMGDKNICLNEGEIIIVSPKQMHYITKEDFAEVFAVNFFIEDNRKIRSQFLEFLGISDCVILPADLECRELLFFLEKAMSRNNKLLVGTYLFAVLVKSSELYSGRRNNDEIESDSDVGRIYMLNRIFEKYYKSDITLDVVARKLHISKRQLSRIIKKQYGCTFKEKVTQFKMMDAANMLSGGASVAETTQFCGYSSASAFYNAFKRTYGMSPAEYREEKM